MHMLRKYREKAKNLPSSIYHNADKNQNSKISNKTDTDSEDEANADLIFEDSVNEYILKMVNFIKELAIFCFIFAAYAAITHDPPKVSKSPAAYPFFPTNSVIKDFYRGQILEAIEQARSSDFSFLMFYAPWDAESQAAKAEFLKTANYLKENVAFAAVNCWQPGSTCRNQYNKVFRWPVLIAYPAFGNGIQYNGPIESSHMISFLQKLMKPVKKASEIILDFEEAFIIAELNTLPGSEEYSVYYSTALKYLENDPLGRISFFVKPVKKTKNQLSFYLWHEVKILDLNQSDWKVDVIMQWILKNIYTTSSWTLPSGSKSLVLSNFLQPGPSLILFTPMNPFYGFSDYYMMLQEISQEYANCNNYAPNFDMKSKRLDNYLTYKHLKKICKSQIYGEKQKDVLSVTTNLVFFNETYNDRKKKNNLNLYEDIKSENCYDIFPQTFKNFRMIEASSSISRKEIKTSMLRDEFDPKSMLNLKKNQYNNKCKNLLEAEKLFKPIFEPVNLESVELSVAKLGCSNQTLEFVALNSLIYYNFAERLGLDLFSKKDKSGVVIVHQKLESHYVMKNAVTSTNIRRFIRNFTNNTLIRSTDTISDITSVTARSYHFNKTIQRSKPIYVKELTSKNFLDVVLNEGKSVLVMYYSKQCSYCNGISYIFLTLARKLSFVKNLQFRRIDGDINILPWEYTMDAFPTILFFPMFKKEETRVFPSDIPIDLTNLLGFVLSNFDSVTKLNAMYSICLHYQLEKEKRSCFTSVRSYTVALIEQMLKQWRKSNNRHRQIVLHNLRQLKQLQFLFTHKPEDLKLIQLYFNKLKFGLTNDYSSKSKESIKTEL